MRNIFLFVLAITFIPVCAHGQDAEVTELRKAFVECSAHEMIRCLKDHPGRAEMCTDSGIQMCETQRQALSDKHKRLSGGLWTSEKQRDRDREFRDQLLVAALRLEAEMDKVANAQPPVRMKIK